MEVSGSYASVIKGVSQQAPADRLEGQHGEVVNMLSDPVRGLVRRNGMILQAQRGATYSSEADPSNALADSYSFRTFTYQDKGTKYDIVYRSRERIGGETDAHLPTLNVYDKTNNAFLPWLTAGADTNWPSFYDAGGISAVTSIGSYVLFASNTLAPSYNLEAGIDNIAWKNSASVWIKGGSYARTYTLTVVRQSTGLTYSVNYTTPASTYPGVLDFTTAIDPADPAYGAFINQTQAAYDTAVNQWISTSSAAIAPENIAQELVDGLTAAGFTGWVRIGSHLVNDDVSYAEINDGGNGDFALAVLTNISSAAEVTAVHRVGKVIRVQPLDVTKESYYLKAYPDTTGNPAAYQKVIWREAAGEIQKPAQIVALGRVYEGKFYSATTPAMLDALILADTGDVVTAPAYVDSTAGDTISAPVPHFYGNRITMLAVFQNRLLVGSDGVVNASEVGDYFNFYRTTMLTIPASDPVEMFALGTEGDTIRKAALYDRNMTLYGDNYHYVINGRQPLDAAAPNMAVQFNIRNSAFAAPVGSGPYVFALKQDDQLAASVLLQVQAGVYQDSPQLTDASQQLRDYINGTPAEIVALTNPSVLFIRTEHFLKSQGGFPRARPWGLYLYEYLDNKNGERINDAFSAWEWSTALGTPIGISDTGTGDGLLLYTVAFGLNEAETPYRAIVVQKASARPDPTGLPYLDGLQPAEGVETTGMFTPLAAPGVIASVYTSPGAAHSYSAVPSTSDEDRFVGLEHPDYTVGDAPPETVDPFRWSGGPGWYSDYLLAYPTAPTDNLWTGLAYPAYVDITNPFMRNREGKAITTGKLKITSLKVTTTRSAGFQASWRDFGARKVTNDVGGQYDRIDYKHSVWVGRDNTEVQIRLGAKDWYPLTITQIEWRGNWFNNTRSA